MTNQYTTPAETGIGLVHLKVSDLDLALSFYCNLLGFELTNNMRGKCCFYFGRRLPSSHCIEHLAQQRWKQSEAISYGYFISTRKDLTEILQRFINKEHPFPESSDYGVLEDLLG